MKELKWHARVLEESNTVIGKIPAMAQLDITLSAQTRGEALKIAHDEAIGRGMGPIRSIDLRAECDLTHDQAIAAAEAAMRESRG